MKTRIAAACILLAATAACNRGAANNSAAAPANGTATATTPGAAPEVAVFAEYDKVCLDLSSPDALRAAAAGNGWEAYTPDAQSDLGKILAFADQTVRPMLGGVELNNAPYRKTVNGRELNLVISAIPSGPAQSTECRVYDFRAPAPSAEAVAAWTSAPPTNRQAQAGLTAWEWTPGFRPGIDQQTVAHLDANSPLRQQIPAVGLGVTATKSTAIAQGEAPATVEAPGADEPAEADTE